MLPKRRYNFYHEGTKYTKGSDIDIFKLLNFVLFVTFVVKGFFCFGCGAAVTKETSGTERTPQPRANCLEKIFFPGRLPPFDHSIRAPPQGCELPGGLFSPSYPPECPGESGAARPQRLDQGFWGAHRAAIPLDRSAAHGPDQ